MPRSYSFLSNIAITSSGSSSPVPQPQSSVLEVCEGVRIFEDDLISENEILRKEKEALEQRVQDMQEILNTLSDLLTRVNRYLKRPRQDELDAAEALTQLGSDLPVGKRLRDDDSFPCSDSGSVSPKPSM